MSDRKKQSEYQAKYDAMNMKQYSVKYPIRIYEKVEKAMADSRMNRNKWTTTAIVEKLQRDGYLLDEDVKESKSQNVCSIKNYVQ